MGTKLYICQCKRICITIVLPDLHGLSRQCMSCHALCIILVTEINVISRPVKTYPCVKLVQTFNLLSLSLRCDIIISINNITKGSFSFEVQEDKAEIIFFLICFCSAITYMGGLHQSGLSFTPERHFKLNYICVYMRD